jgi:hypothetical protein
MAENDAKIEAPAELPEEPIIPPGKPLRPRAAIVVLLGLLVPFLLMTTDVHFALSVPIGFAALAVAAWGVLDFTGTLDDAAERSISVRELSARLVELLGSAIVFVLVVRLAVVGRLPFPRLSAAILVSAALFWVILAGYRVLARLGAVDTSVPLHHRWGFWLVSLSIALYVPFLGSYSLSDPWEAHYGEVAREMRARAEWI